MDAGVELGRKAGLRKAGLTAGVGSVSGVPIGHWSPVVKGLRSQQL